MCHSCAQWRGEIGAYIVGALDRCARDRVTRHITACVGCRADYDELLPVRDWLSLPRLRDLLDAGHDVEDDDGDGWTLLRHAIDVEHDGHVQTGGPLHADVTAFLLARGADPLRPYNGVSVIAEAETRGHWLATEIMRAWIGRGNQPKEQGEGSR